ncbi:dTMP kinase [Lichenicola sp.]|uniref:dTMP kinase n=1 Tax=Lichenicola sp. TaxID=2804529 RepID=UPI003B00129D
MTEPLTRGLFITLEGGEGAGKSTQARLLDDALARRGRKVLRTREPGGAPGAEQLREFLLKGDHGLSLRAEVLLHFAARLDHIERTIRPALDAGQVVICDRFFDSTLAYQGYGLAHGDPALLEFIARLIDLTGLMPNLTLLLAVPRTLARTRMQQRGGGSDRYERLDEAFHLRVADGFRRIADQAPGRIATIDAGGDVEQVQQALLTEIDRRLPA